MMNSPLDFRTLLSIIAIIFGDGEFTARDLSDRMMEATRVIALNSPQALELVQNQTYLERSQKTLRNGLPEEKEGEERMQSEEREGMLQRI